MTTFLTGGDCRSAIGTSADPAAVTLEAHVLTAAGWLDPPTRHEAGSGTAAAISRMAKRAIDVVAGTALAVASLPVVLLLALGSAFSLRAWPFFVHERVGWRGRRYRIVKLRTLPKSTPRYTEKVHLGTDRLPRFVRAMRAYHLDELPQLFLVPFGRMSLVGPRPEMPRLHRELPASFARRRTSVRPGCTGIWQISVASSGMIRDDPAIDEYYLDHWSVGLDLWILVKTALLMLGLSRPIDPNAVAQRTPAPRMTASMEAAPALVESTPV